MTTTHTTESVTAFDASEPGALSGYAATCSCGYVMKTSLSEREAAKLGDAHAQFMNRKR